jgi:hypothetical protein
MTGFTSLTACLEEWFDEPLSALPAALQQRIKEDFFPMPWNTLSADQRRSVARQWDANNDPALAHERKFWWDFFIRKGELEEQIARWTDTAAPTASELDLKEKRLLALREELAQMEHQERQGRGDFLDEQAKHLGAAATSLLAQDAHYIAYPKAMHSLAKRLQATPEELAAWLFMGPENGGMLAYRNANQLSPPPQFHFAVGSGDPDYLSPLMGCWFKEEDIAKFEPVDRYLTGKALIERWSMHPGIQAESYIRAKIGESRLMEIHPTFGTTRGSFPEKVNFPPIESGLFVLSHVENIEAKDFGNESSPPEFPASSIAPVSADKIVLEFQVLKDFDQNNVWWKKEMRKASRNKLAPCRVGAGKTGPGGSLWRPELIAGWLVDRHENGLVGMSTRSAAAALKRFPGGEEVAERFFKPNSSG